MYQEKLVEAKKTCPAATERNYKFLHSNIVLKSNFEALGYLSFTILCYFILLHYMFVAYSNAFISQLLVTLQIQDLHANHMVSWRNIIHFLRLNDSTVYKAVKSALLWSVTT